jgi:hypothetical protein
MKRRFFPFRSSSSSILPSLNMPPLKKRKAAILDHTDEILPRPRVSEEEKTPGMAETTTPSTGNDPEEPSSGDDESAKDNTAALKAQERKEKFKALQARAVSLFSFRLSWPYHWDEHHTILNSRGLRTLSV